MSKSYENSDPRLKYSLEHSTPLNMHVEELFEVLVLCHFSEFMIYILR